MLAKRIFFGSIFAAIVVVFLMFRTAGFMALILALGCISIYEINNAFKQGGIKSSPIFGYVFVVLLIPTYLFIGDMGIFVIFGLCMYLNFCYFILRKKVDSEMLYSNLQFVYPCLPISFTCPMLLAEGNQLFGFTVMIAIVLCCIATDIFAYFSGVYLGKHKLSPTVSPKKTVEGSIGGFLGSVIMSVALYYLFPLFLYKDMSLWFLLCLGIVCGIFAQFGDLTASMIKRICGIKDFGNLIPGHGGVLDRLDSILFCIPVSYTVILLFKALGGI